MNWMGILHFCVVYAVDRIPVLAIHALVSAIRHSQSDALLTFLLSNYAIMHARGVA